MNLFKNSIKFGRLITLLLVGAVSIICWSKLDLPLNISITHEPPPPPEVVNKIVNERVVQLSYIQGSLDMYVQQQFGNKVAESVVTQRKQFLSKCVVETSLEVKCREQWIAAQINKIAETLNHQRKLPNTPL